MKVLCINNTKGKATPLAEALPDFIAMTIKPQCTKRYRGLTPLQQCKLITRVVKESVDRLKGGVDIIGYELHFERFMNGNLHAHGAIYCIGSLKDTIWADQFQKDFIQRYKALGKYSCLAKLPFGEQDGSKKWVEYMNKSNILPAKYFMTPLGNNLQFRWLNSDDEEISPPAV